MSTFLVAATILLPLLGGAVCLFWRGAPEKAISGIAVTFCAAEVVLVAAVFAYGDGLGVTLPFTAELGIFLSVDSLGRFFGLLAAFVWLLVALFAIPYLSHEGGEHRFFGFFLATLGAVVGVGYAGNILTLYLFFELMTLASVPLVMHSLTTETKQAAGAYLVYSVLGATLGLFGALYFTIGNPQNHPAFALIMAFLSVVGFCCKAGLAPFHGWLPLAPPVAPAPASAVLSGIITKCGVIAAIRVIFEVVGVKLLAGSWVQTALLWMALITILLGSSLAYSEKVLKKRLAYSSVSQLSYLLLGVFLMSSAGLTGALLQLLFHALAKVVLFLSAGAILLLLHRTRVTELDGAGKKLPVVMGCFTIASLSLVGIPPLGGAVSKWQLAVAGLTSGMGAVSYLIPVVLVVSALLTAGYLFPVVQSAFFCEPDNQLAAAKVKTPGVIAVSLVLLCGGLVVFGCFPAPVTEFLSGIAAGIL
ncbi:MAG: proton-conducting transporter membrane subunit [Angelakisella sp.]